MYIYAHETTHKLTIVAKKRQRPNHHGRFFVVVLTTLNKCRQLLWNSFLLKQTSPTVTNYKQKWDRVSSQFISHHKGEYANIVGGGGASRKGEIGLKTAWGEMLTMRQRQEEGGGRREREQKKGSLTDQVVKRWLPACPQIVRQKPLQYSPLQLTEDCTASSILLRTSSDIINTFTLRRKIQGLLGVGQQPNAKKFPTSSNLNWHPLWASYCTEVPHSLSSKQHHT